MKEKYSRKIELVCPVCGGKLFQYDVEDDNEPLKCILCNTEFNKQEIQDRNMENIDANMDELKKEIIDDVRDEFRSIIKGIKK